jgi:hypothetical protein
MKKILTIIAIALLAIDTQAQNRAKAEADKKALGQIMETINEMDQMLGKEFTQITTALNVVNGATFTMGECIVLGAYADEGFKKNCKAAEDEFNQMFNNSIWSFAKYNPNGQSLVNVKTIAGKALSSPYSGYEGDATVKIGMLVDGLTIHGYFYRSKADKNKYIMMFPISQMGLFVEMTKKDGGAAANVSVKGNDTNSEPTNNKTATPSPKVDEAKNKVKNAVKGKLDKLL